MDQLAAILLIIGCSDDLGTCRQVPVAEPVHASVMECEARLPDAMADQIGDFPQILAQCLPANDPQAVRVEWNVSPEGHLLASVETKPEYLAQLNDAAAQPQN
jgi:hypothetical protein